MTSQTKAISVISQPNREQLDKLDVFNWSIWTKEASEFPWIYDEAETCYFLEGEVVVTPTGASAVKMGQGDLVTFPAGMSCTWKVIQPVKKHYQFG
ncbi:MAG: cupin domain-containing protein [Cyanobacteria bacterium J06600_6]